MDPNELNFLTRCSVACRMIGHPFPDMAACEAAWESSKPGIPWQLSELARDGNNLFGMKVHKHNDFGTITLPTREFLSGEWKIISADFEKYETLQDCFMDRLATLRRLSPVFPHYQAALTAETPEEYISEVSKSWSTDPMRAVHVLELYRKYVAEIAPPIS